jgi:hypothetical protein
MSSTERSRRRRALQEALDAGRAAKIDRINDATREALSPDAPEERARKLKSMEASWSRWLLVKSAGSGALDRATVASAFAKLQQICEDETAEQIRRLLRAMESW